MSGKKPSFMKKMLQENEKKRSVIADKLQGESYLYAGDPSLQWGTGGWARSHMNLVYGPSKSGKSTILLMAAGKEQAKSGGVVVIFDSEWGYGDIHETDLTGEYTIRAKKTRDRLKKANISLDDVVIWQTNIGTDLFSYLSDIEDDLKKDPNCVCSIIVDSWGGIQPEQARNKLEKGQSDDAGKSFGGNAKTINPLVQQLLRISNTYGVTVYGVQHVMVNQSEYGPKFLLPGGQKMIHLHETILFVEGLETKNKALLEGEVSGTSTDDTSLKIGKMVNFRCEKSRATVEGKTGCFYMNFRDMKFAQPAQSLFDLAVRLGVVVHPIKDDGKESIAWWQFPAKAATPLKWNGQANAVTALGEDKDLFNKVYEDCLTSSKMHAIDRNELTPVEVDGAEVSSIVSEGKKGA